MNVRFREFHWFGLYVFIGWFLHTEPFRIVQNQRLGYTALSWGHLTVGVSI